MKRTINDRKQRMEPYGYQIASDVRQRMSICPPPPTTLDGKILSYPSTFTDKYHDLFLKKQEKPISIEEYLDRDRTEKMIRMGYAPSDEYYYLQIRGLSNDYDLRVIGDAAKHLCFISDYSIERGLNDAVAKEYQREWVRLAYRLYQEPGYWTSDSELAYRTVYLSTQQRLKIWIDLFTAAGYRVREGTINIRSAR